MEQRDWRQRKDLKKKTIKKALNLLCLLRHKHERFSKTKTVKTTVMRTDRSDKVKAHQKKSKALV